MKKRKLGFVAVGLLAVCVTAMGGMFLLDLSVKDNNAVPVMSSIVENEVPSDTDIPETPVIVDNKPSVPEATAMPVTTAAPDATALPDATAAPNIEPVTQIAIAVPTSEPSIPAATDTPVAEPTEAPPSNTLEALNIPKLTPLTARKPASKEEPPVIIETPLTVIEDKPEPPEPPITAFQFEATEEEKYAIAVELGLTDPNVKPDSNPIPAVTAPPVEVKPQEEEERKGMMFVPGFGWIVDEGCETITIIGQLDPEHADFNKIIGY